MDTSLKALRYFLAAVENGSITQAAKQMNVVPSAVLAAVNQVESAFALKLTTRQRSKGIAPTATGQILMVRIRHILEEYDTLIAAGTEMRTQLTGTLRVGYYAPVAPAFLPAIVKRLYTGNPGVDIKFTEGDNQIIQAGLLSGAFDVIICVAESMIPDVTFETLIAVPAYVLVSRTHPFAMRASIALAELKAEDLVLLDLPVVREYYSRIFAEVGITPKIACTATTLEMVRSLVGTGLGCSILHMRPATDLTYAGNNVVGIPLDPAPDPLKIVLGHLPDNPRRLVRAFVDSVRELFSKDDAKRLLVTLPEI